MEEKYCGICLYLGTQITKKGLLPYCKKNKNKFKEVREVNYHEGELFNKKCDEFKNYQS